MEQTGVGDRQDEQAEDHAVPGKHAEAVAGHEADEPVHAGQRAEEREDGAHGKQRDVAGAQQVAALPGVIDAGADERGDGQVEGELGGHLPRQTEDHAADDGGAGTAGARDKREGLRQTQLQRIDGGEAVDVGDARRDVFLAFFHQEDDQAPHHQGDSHRHRTEQVGLDELAEQHAQHRRRDEGDDDVERKALLHAVGREASQHLADALAVIPDDGQDGARLDGDGKDTGLFVIPAQQGAGEDEVAGAGDGEELGQALDNAEDDGLDHQGECVEGFHGAGC